MEEKKRIKSHFASICKKNQLSVSGRLKTRAVGQVGECCGSHAVTDDEIVLLGRRPIPSCSGKKDTPPPVPSEKTGNGIDIDEYEVEGGRYIDVWRRFKPLSASEILRLGGSCLKFSGKWTLSEH